MKRYATKKESERGLKYHLQIEMPAILNQWSGLSGDCGRMRQKKGPIGNGSEKENGPSMEALLIFPNKSESCQFLASILMEFRLLHNNPPQLKFFSLWVFFFFNIICHRM
jgi:hypothetical protein